MKLTLQITASAQTLAAILANLPDDATVDGPNAPSTSTGTGTPVESASTPSAPNMAAPTPTAPSQPMMPQPTPSPVSAPLAPAGSGESGGTANNADDDEGDAADGTPDRDANGLPWDERIHSKGKNRLNADGTWRKRRGVDDATVAAVEAELRGGGQPAPAPQMQVPQQPIPLPPTLPNTQPSAPPVMAAPMPQPAPAPAPAPMPQPAPAPMQEAVNAAMGMPTPQPTGSLDFMGVMQHLGPKFQERDANGQPLLHADYLAAVAAEVGTAFGQQLNAFTDIQQNQQMVDYAVQIFARDGKW